MDTKILCVDDEENVVLGYRRSLRKSFKIITATSGVEALEKLKNDGPYAVIVSDMQMPSMTGVELLAQSMEIVPDTVRIMLTGNADQKTAIDAVNDGNIFQFLNKPCSSEVLEKAISRGVRQYKLVTAEKELLENTLNGSIKTLLDILSMMDQKAFSRSQQLKKMVQRFCTCFDVQEVWELELAAMLSDIGKITIPPLVLQKIQDHQVLTDEEKKIYEKVPELSHNLISNIPRLEDVAEIIFYQNKNYDGSGFPLNNKKGEDIPVGARILKILSELVYLESRGIDKFSAIEEMQKRQGVYDIQILTAAAAGFEEVEDEEYTVQEITCIKDFSPGQILLGDISDQQGTMILSNGNELTSMHIQKIKNFSEITKIVFPITVRVPNYSIKVLQKG
ncbi:MAG: HD domain-containing phosphohydrolase [Verrucomicrobiota bacterium]